MIGVHEDASLVLHLVQLLIRVSACAHGQASSGPLRSDIPCGEQARGIQCQVPPDLPKQHFLAVLRREHDMVLALPCRLVQVIMIL